MVEEEYKFIVQWLQKEPNPDLVVTYIKERKEKGFLSPVELDSLRHQVIDIKKKGHASYLEQDAMEIIRGLFPGAIDLGDSDA